MARRPALVSVDGHEDPDEVPGKMVSMFDGDDAHYRHQCHVLSAVMEHGLLRPSGPATPEGDTLAEIETPRVVLTGSRDGPPVSPASAMDLKHAE